MSRAARRVLAGVAVLGGAVVAVLLIAESSPFSALYPPESVATASDVAGDVAGDLADNRRARERAPASAAGPAAQREQPVASCESWSPPVPERHASLATDRLAERIQTELQQAAHDLAASPLPEHWLAAGMLRSSWRDEQADAPLQRAAANASQSELAQWVLLARCNRDGGAARCSDDVLDGYLQGPIVDNGAAWAGIAETRLGRGDTAGGYAALRRASSTPVYTSYFADSVALVERALNATSGLSQAERFNQAVTVAIMQGSSWGAITHACRNTATGSAEWRICFDYASRLESAGNTLLEQNIGIGMQIALLRAGGASAALADALHREVAIREPLRRGLSNFEMAVLNTDERVLSEYLDELVAHGEAGAFRYLTEESRRLASIVGYDPCKVAR